MEEQAWEYRTVVLGWLFKRAMSIRQRLGATEKRLARDGWIFVSRSRTITGRHELLFRRIRRQPEAAVAEEETLAAI
jgi:hypothetical protein